MNICCTNLYNKYILSKCCLFEKKSMLKKKKKKKKGSNIGSCPQVPMTLICITNTFCQNIVYLNMQ